MQADDKVEAVVPNSLTAAQTTRPNYPHTTVTGTQSFLIFHSC